MYDFNNPLTTFQMDFYRKKGEMGEPHTDKNITILSDSLTETSKTQVNIRVLAQTVFSSSCFCCHCQCHATVWFEGVFVYYLSMQLYLVNFYHVPN